MKVVIVPVDFSDTSMNAARYASQLLSGHYGVELILYHMYEKESHAAETGKSLENLKKELLQKGILKIKTLVEIGDDFIEKLTKLARHQEADLIIMGITGRSSIEQALIGSNTLEIVEKKVCPVLIIPSRAEYRVVKNVLLTSDFKNVADATPAVTIKKIISPFRPNLHILNVDSDHYVALTEEYQAERAKLAEIFAELNPEFYFLGWHDVDEAISQFATDKQIDIIITIPKENSLLTRMFRPGYTKKLAYHSAVPILAAPE